MFVTGKTYIPHKGEAPSKWYVVDADSQVLGRVATQIAVILRGKHRVDFTPFLDLGDHVIVVNAAKVRLTGNKGEQKMYRRYTGYPGGLREIQAHKLLEQKPEKLLREAVLGMLPKSKLGKALGKKLLVYAGGDHPHQAQQPEVYPFLKANS